MEEDIEFIENGNFLSEETVREVIQDGEILSRKFAKDVYAHEDLIPGLVIKIPYSGDREGIARRLARVDNELVPVRGLDVHDLPEGYDGNMTVVVAEKSDYSMLEGLDDNNYKQRFLDGIELMDSAASGLTAFTDLVWENLHYFDGELKLIDLCEVGDIKSFPEDYFQPDDWESFAVDVEEMYTNFAVSGVYESDRGMGEAVELLTENSRYIDSAETLEEDGLRLDQQLRISLDESLFRY